MAAGDGKHLGPHLEARYGIGVSSVAALDSGVFQVDRRDGPSWVARAFPEDRAVDGVEGDARILRALEAAGFPAERCADPEPVSCHDGHPVLVTEFVPAAGPVSPRRTFAILGSLLGRLHARPGTGVRDGGAWHHLSHTGGPRQEIAAAVALLESALPEVGVRELSQYHRLLDELRTVDDCQDLPHAFVHPDFVPANAIPTPGEHLVIVDWAGAGRGPRLWSLGFLLWAAGMRSPGLVDAVVSRYRRHVQLDANELDRLAGAIRGRPIMLECWGFGSGRRSVDETVQHVAEARQLSGRIAAQARHAFETPTGHAPRAAGD